MSLCVDPGVHNNLSPVLFSFPILCPKTLHRRVNNGNSKARIFLLGLFEQGRKETVLIILVKNSEGMTIWCCWHLHRCQATALEEVVC